MMSCLSMLMTLQILAKHRTLSSAQSPLSSSKIETVPIFQNTSIKFSLLPMKMIQVEFNQTICCDWTAKQETKPAYSCLANTSRTCLNYARWANKGSWWGKREKVHITLTLRGARNRHITDSEWLEQADRSTPATRRRREWTVRSPTLSHSLVETLLLHQKTTNWFPVEDTAEAYTGILLLLQPSAKYFF